MFTASWADRGLMHLMGCDSVTDVTSAWHPPACRAAARQGCVVPPPVCILPVCQPSGRAQARSHDLAVRSPCCAPCTLCTA